MYRKCYRTGQMANNKYVCFKICLVRTPPHGYSTTFFLDGTYSLELVSSFKERGSKK